MTARAWTIGHGARTIDGFLALLAEHGIEVLADVRRFPTSRWEPFRQENLRASLAAAGIAYAHLGELGGFRPGGYEAFAATKEFARGIERLLAFAADRRVAILCAEADPARCHRRHVADALARRGVDVTHIVGPGTARRHAVQARLEGASRGRTRGEP